MIQALGRLFSLLFSPCERQGCKPPFEPKLRSPVPMKTMQAIVSSLMEATEARTTSAQPGPEAAAVALLKVSLLSQASFSRQDYSHLKHEVTVCVCVCVYVQVCVVSCLSLLACFLGTGKRQEDRSRHHSKCRLSLNLSIFSLTPHIYTSLSLHPQAQNISALISSETEPPIPHYMEKAQLSVIQGVAWICVYTLIHSFCFQHQHLPPFLLASLILGASSF